MPLTGEQLELSYFIPTSENVTQILNELRQPQPECPLAERDKDFYLFRSRGSQTPWRWEGAGRYAERKSKTTFKSEADAIAHAQQHLRP